MRGPHISLDCSAPMMMMGARRFQERTPTQTGAYSLIAVQMASSCSLFLEWLRTRHEIDALNDVARGTLLKEAEYYGVDRLVEQLRRLNHQPTSARRR